MSTVRTRQLAARFEHNNLHQWLDKDQDLFETRFISEFKGKGLFTKEKCVPGQFLMFYRGKRLRQSEYADLYNSERNEYVFVIKDGAKENTYIDATDEQSGLARYINDCGFLKPNCEPRLHTFVKDGLKFVYLDSCLVILINLQLQSCLAFFEAALNFFFVNHLYKNSRETFH